MNLVRKKDKRGQVEKTLKTFQREAMLKVFSKDRKSSEADNKIADVVLNCMYTDELWLECDCIEPVDGQEKPFNCRVQRNKKVTLRHVETSGHHNETCPLYRLKKDRDGNDSRAEAKVSPLIPVGDDDWLPEKKKAAKVNPGDGTARARGTRRKSLKPVPALGRKLLTLLQTAGLNQLELYPSCAPIKVKPAIDAINQVLKENTMRNGKYLSEIINCSPWLSINDIDQKLQTLESDDEMRTGTKEACIYIVGLAESVTKEEIVFELSGRPYPHKPAARVSINGENSHNAGCRGPYWAIIEYRRDQSGQVFCAAGYAHAAESRDNTIPVDSNKEKDTLNAIIDATEYVCKKYQPLAISLIKPLFSMKSIKDGVEEIIHPDFIVNVVPEGEKQVTTFIIETMGYELAEYVERKGRTHEFMRREGTLLTDPPTWPEKPKDGDKTFNQCLLSLLFGAVK
ncbi:hypothetical protein CYD30_24560 [Kosakonia cowanii]|nr:hypothetical protein CYD30_24560 [Kosakonia cowanii]